MPSSLDKTKFEQYMKDALKYFLRGDTTQGDKSLEKACLLFFNCQQKGPRIKSLDNLPKKNYDDYIHLCLAMKWASVNLNDPKSKHHIVQKWIDNFQRLPYNSNMDFI